MFWNRATQKDDRDRHYPLLYYDSQICLGRRIKNMNTVIRDQQQKRIYVCLFNFGYVFYTVKSCVCCQIRREGSSLAFFKVHLSLFHADLFGPWGWGAGAFAPIAPPLPTRLQFNEFSCFVMKNCSSCCSQECC